MIRSSYDALFDSGDVDAFMDEAYGIPSSVYDVEMGVGVCIQ